MNESVLKGNDSHNNVLNMRQCGKCFRFPQKKMLQPIEHRALKLVNFSEQYFGYKKTSKVVLTSC